MKNIDCDSCGSFSRQFRIDWDHWLEGHDQQAFLPAFFDLDENVSLFS